MTESEIIDEILNALNENRDTSVKDDPNYRQGLGKAFSYKLIEIRGKFSFTYPTEKGYEVIREGGFDKWKQTKEKQASELHQATLASSKATVDAEGHAEQSKNSAWVAVVLTAISLIVGIYQVWNSNEQDKKVNAMQKRVDTLDSLLRLLPQSQITKADSMKIQKKK